MPPPLSASPSFSKPLISSPCQQWSEIGNWPARESTAGYRSLNEFVITYRRGEGNANYSAIFRREGLVTWKLAAINLNE